MKFNRSHVLDCKQGAVRTVRYNYDGEYVITTGNDKTIKLWNPRKQLMLNKYNGHRSDVLDAVSSHDNSLIVSGGQDKLVLLFEVTDQDPVRKFQGHEGQVNCVQFNGDSSVVFSGSFDGAVKVWDVRSRSRTPIQSLNDAKDSVSSIAIHEHEVVTGCLDGKVRKYDIRTGSLTTDDVLYSVSSVCFTKDSQCILTNCLNNTIVLIDKESGEVLQEFLGHRNSKFKVNSCLLDNDSLVLSGSEDGFVYCWSLIDGKVQDKYSHVQHKVVHSIACHPTKQEFVAAAEGTIYLWD